MPQPNSILSNIFGQKTIELFREKKKAFFRLALTRKTKEVYYNGLARKGRSRKDKQMIISMYSEKYF